MPFFASNAPGRRFPIRLLTGALGLGLVITAVPGGADGVSDRHKPRPGSTRSGDSLIPQAGNGGYDVWRYRVTLDYHPKSRRLEARTRIAARAEHPLSSFSLDLQGLRVSRVDVNGHAAAFRRHAHELVITPRSAVRDRFVTTVVYSGRAHGHTDADGSSEGWLNTKDGATALNEPVGAMTWFPVNNTPRDKARYTFRVTVPSRLEVASNGMLTGRHRAAGRTTWTWKTHAPMAAYLALVSIGDYHMYRSTISSVSGRRLPVWTFVQRGLPAQHKNRRLLPKVLRWEERRFGRYPFGSTGMVFHRLAVDYSLETQNRPFFPGGTDTLTLVHEVAHQWFGDSVTPRDWGDIWLNEGFATYSEWLWTAAHGGKSPRQTFRFIYRANRQGSPLWSPAPAALSDPADLFGDPEYTRGAMTLQVLRNTVGTEAFFDILRTWTRQHVHGHASTTQFIRLAERISGKELDTVFRDWIYTASRPKGY